MIYRSQRTESNYDYDPSAIPAETDVDGFNQTVSHVRINPKGVMNGATPSGTPFFELFFRVRVE